MLGGQDVILDVVVDRRDGPSGTEGGPQNTSEPVSTIEFRGYAYTRELS